MCCCGSPNVNNPDWMSGYADETHITELSIPGTHNSMARCGGVWVKCQDWSLTDQYEAGIRFVDIRCRHVNDSLPIYHGYSFQHAHFTKDVVEATMGFLNNNSTETVIMLIKHEDYKPKKGHLEFHELVRNALNKGAKDCWIDSMPVTLGDARGKIIVMHQDWPPGPTIGKWIKSVELENSWKEHLVEEKWIKVESALRAAHDGEKRDMYVTFSSGYTEGCFGEPYPNKMAKSINRRLLDFVRNTTSQRQGAILMDFPSGNLIEQLI